VGFVGGDRVVGGGEAPGGQGARTPGH
jgi:hypothetical protein